MRVALRHAAVLADHALAILDRDVVSLGKELSRGGHVFAHHIHALKNAAHQVGDNIRVVPIEVVAHGPHIGDQVVGASGGHDEPGAGHLVGNCVNVRRPANKGLEGLVLNKNLCGRRRVAGPFEIDLRRVNARVDEQRHHQVMARRVLRQHHFAAFPIAHPKVIDVANVAAGHDAIAAARPVDLLADDWHGAGVFDQFGSEQRHHVERAPEDMAVTAGEEVARFDRVIDDGELQIETVFLVKNAPFIRIQPVVGDNNRGPARPNVNRELDDELAVFHRLVVIADAADRRDR